MKKLLSIYLLILLTACSSYTPIYTTNQINFYIDKIEIENDNKLTRKIIKKLKPYTIKNEKQSITLKLNLKKQESIIMKDAKGDPASFEVKVNLKVNIKSKNNDKELNFEEKFNFNNKSNKFELNQYKKTMETNVLNKIFESLILELRNI